jgi:DNA-binding transcriptional MocR family regulator
MDVPDGLGEHCGTGARLAVGADGIFDTLGNLALRQPVRRMAATGIDASPEQVMLTESGTQAIDLIFRFLLKPGDKVLVDDPCYFNFHALLKAHQVQAIGVPYTAQGPDLPLFEKALQEHSPRLYITNWDSQPDWSSPVSTRCPQTLLVDSSELVIVEDDIFADFESTTRPDWLHLTATRHPHRQLFKDGVGIHTLRIRGCQARVD